MSGRNGGEIVILGCSGSGGVPRSGNDWGICDPANPKNRRTRPSILIRSGHSSVVIDSGPDFREQTCRENITRIDALIFTHVHTDHTAGIDDIRPYWENQGLKDAGEGFPIFADQVSLDDLHHRFNYLFSSRSTLYPRRLHPHVIRDDQMGQELSVTADLSVIPFIQIHGNNQRSLGFRIGNVGYSTDMTDLDAAAINVLQGIDTWVADGNNYYQEKSYVHANKETLLRLQAQIKPKQIFLTHLDHKLDYAQMRADLPDGFAPAYDGLVIPFKVD
ncbi:MAG: MBL fold metallo-hydrolase [Pseudomonadota bacterium]